MPILIKPLLFLIAFGPMAVLFASVIALACGLLALCVRAIRLLLNVVTSTEPERPVPRPYLQPHRLVHKVLN
jgi:hypothetical protein